MTWTCPRCTLINDSSSTTCDACGHSARPPDKAPLAAPSNTQPPPPEPSSYLSLLSTCPGCRRSIWSPGSSTVQALGNSYHHGCFRCTACAQPLPSGVRFSIHENEPYHTQCFQQLYHPRHDIVHGVPVACSTSFWLRSRCDVCDEWLPIHADGRSPYNLNVFWQQKYCPLHEQRDRCCSCRRIEPTARAKHFESLVDGRKLCGDCATTVIVQPVVQDVWAFLASLGLHLPEVPVFLVDFDTLNAQSHSAHSNMPRESKAPAVYGVCLSDVDHFAHRSVQQFFRLEMAPTRRVHGIMVLHGLPFDMTAYILAHEATHAYFKLHDGFPTSLPLKVEEGTCQLVGYLYLQYRKVMAGDDSDRPHAAKLRDWYLESLVNDPSPVYGDGLRDALHAFNSTNSLQVLLDHIRETSAFPSV